MPLGTRFLFFSFLFLLFRFSSHCFVFFYLRFVFCGFLFFVFISHCIIFVFFSFFPFFTFYRYPSFDTRSTDLNRTKDIAKQVFITVFVSLAHGAQYVVHYSWCPICSSLFISDLKFLVKLSKIQRYLYQVDTTPF